MLTWPAKNQAAQHAACTIRGCLLFLWHFISASSWILTMDCTLDSCVIVSEGLFSWRWCGYLPCSDSFLSMVTERLWNTWSSTWTKVNFLASQDTFWLFRAAYLSVSSVFSSSSQCFFTHRMVLIASRGYKKSSNTKGLFWCLICQRCLTWCRYVHWFTKDFCL